MNLLSLHFAMKEQIGGRDNSVFISIVFHRLTISKYDSLEPSHPLSLNHCI